MPCHTRMKTVYLRGLLWLYLLGFGYLAQCVEPGFLDFDNLPDTNFSCVGKVIGGYYADLETNCQMFHVCTIGQLEEPMDIRFLCLNGTVFDQETRVCERIDEVDCSKSEKFYSLNLELYGNTQPSISEDNAETDPPIIIKASTTTTTTTTTTTPKPKPKTTKTAFFTTGTPTVTTVTKVISAHHFPISNSPDIRFNPEEINISLHPGASPSVRSKSVTYQQQVFNGNDNNKKVVVTTHTSYGTPEKEEDFVRVTPNTQRTISSTQRVKNQSPATPSDINYGFTYLQTEDNSQEYTEAPRFQYHHSNIPFRHGQFRNQFKTTTYRTEHLPTTRKHTYHKEPTTYRAHPYASSVKAPTYHTYRTDKPQRLQLPLPILPTLPPLTFSSPAPFSLGHHVETKRYTNDHQAPPRIIISASASVSDNSGRRLNYSLGTIGVTPLLEEPPRNYDDYKDHDVVLDPFYHDVPKIKTRRKRQTNNNNNSEQAAVDVLKFLFDWYSTQQKSSTVKGPIDPEIITEINQELAPLLEPPITENNQNQSDELNFKESALFKQKSKFNIVGDVLSVTEQVPVSTEGPTPVTVPKLDTADYVDDNYEGVAQRTSTVTEEVTTVTETTLAPTTTTTVPTTTSRIMGLMRKRARVHNKRIMNENKRRYQASVNALKPKIRRKGRQRTTTESTTNPTEAQEPLSTTDTTSAKTVATAAPPTEEDLVTTTQIPEEVKLTDKDVDEHTAVLDNDENLRMESQEDLISESLKNFGREYSHSVHDQLNEESQIGANTAAHLEEIVIETEEPQANVTSKEEDEESWHEENEQSSSEEATLSGEEQSKEDPEPETATQSEESRFDEVDEAGEHEDSGSNEDVETVMEPSEEPKIEEETTDERVEIATSPEFDTTEGSTEEISVKPEDDLPEAETSAPRAEDYSDDSIVPKETTTYSSITTEETTLDVQNMITSTTESYNESTTVDAIGSGTDSMSTTPEMDIEVTNLTPAQTTTSPSVTRGRRPRPSRVRTSSSYRKPNPRHRFSTEITSRPTQRKAPIEEAITHALTSQLTTTESIKDNNFPTSTKVVDYPEDVPTDAPLYKSANPTQAESVKESLHTTPLSMMYKLHVRKSYIFNCFGKAINKFYSDPRDCRLFHYCTSGYTKNQLLDMKFVCDQGTYFDEEKLICTKIRPARCL